MATTMGWIPLLESSIQDPVSESNQHHVLFCTRLSRFASRYNAGPELRPMSSGVSYGLT